MKRVSGQGREAIRIKSESGQEIEKMPKPTGPTDPRTIRLINLLERSARVNEARIWLRVADLMRRPRRRRVEVNLGEIDRQTEGGDTVVVPGVVLGKGRIDKSVRIGALKFSGSARRKIADLGGRALKIEEIVADNPKGTDVKILT